MTTQLMSKVTGIETQFITTNPDAPTDAERTADTETAHDLLQGISRESLCSTLRTFEREMVARAHKKVLASRPAAEFLHIPAALDEEFGISGLDMDQAREVLRGMRERGCTAALGEELEAKMVHIAHEKPHCTH